MDTRLFVQAIVKVTLGMALMCALLFFPAGTVHYPQAWQLLVVLFVPMVIAGVVMMMRAPDLLRRRLNMRESEPEQKRVIALSALMFIAGFALAGLDFRMGFSMLPRWVSAAASVVFLAGYLLFAAVLRQNAYLSRTIEVQEGQKLVDTGLYGLVRHPMYTASVLLFLSMPLILGSGLAFVIFLAYPAIIVRRMDNEEAVLSRDLEGYAAYMKRVRYRLIPYVY